MRLTSIIFAISVTITGLLSAKPTTGQALRKTVSVEYYNTNAYAILHDLQLKLDVDFAFTDNLALERVMVKSLKVKGKKLEELLHRIFKDTGIGFTERSGAVTLFRQVAPGVIHGMVTDQQGLSLPGASIRVRELNLGTSTDGNGSYSLQVPPGSYSVEVSYVSYETQVRSRVSVQEGVKTKIDFVLSESREKLSEVVITGYATQIRDKSVASVAQLDNKELDRTASGNVMQAIQGKLAGVFVPVSSGQPGENPSIAIRGGTSLDGKGEPLVIIDGVFRTLNDINPNDIESVQVLKDAASTAVYGARGANGIIVITSKSGRLNAKPQITFRYQTGVETQARDYEYLNARDYLVLARNTWAAGKDVFNIQDKLYRSGNSATVPTYSVKGQYGKALYTPAYLENLVGVEGQEYVDNLLAKGWETIDDPVNPGNTIIFYDNRYQDIIWKTAKTQNYDVSLTGGTEKSNYYFSMGYVDQGGVFLGTSYKRFSGTGNMGFKVSDRFKLDGSFSYLWNDNKKVNTINYTLYRGAKITPLHRIYDDNGEPMIGESISVRYRPHELKYQDIEDNTEQITMRLAGDLTLARGLSYRPSVSFYINNYTSLYFERYFPGQSLERNKSHTVNSGRQFMTDQILQYDVQIADNHNLMLLLGANYTQGRNLDFMGSGQRSTTDYISTFTGDPAASLINGVNSANFSLASRYAEQATLSQFAQLSYDYRNRYLLSASLRHDGFSNFAKNNRFAMFPSVAAGWNVHEESFWNVPFLSKLKVRSSYGETGLSSLVNTDTYGGYSANVYASAGGVLRTSLPNPNLVWETTAMLDAGIETAILDNRFHLAFDFYNKVTRNRLASLPLSSETGFSAIKYNVGKMQNKGIELEVDANWIRHRDLRWNTRFSFAYNRPKVLELPDNGRTKNRIGGGTVYDVALGRDNEVGGYAEGERPHGVWAFKSNGIFATEEEAQASNVEDRMVTTVAMGKKKNAGDVNWADLNGDNIIDTKDAVFMGYKTPDKIGGMQNTVQYKGISLRIAVDFAMGHILSNGSLARSMGSVRAANDGAVSFALDERVWKEDGQQDAVYPRFSFGDTDYGYRNHVRRLASDVGTGIISTSDGSLHATDVDFYISKADFLAFREVSLKYAVPVQWLERIKVAALEFNAGVFNLGYLTRFNGLNPEVYTAFDAIGYPRPRQFVFGATIRF